MPYDNLNKGVTAIQQGKLAEGARLLKIALKSEDLVGTLRATALTWLAETKETREEKLACYKEALQCDPTYEKAHRRMAALLDESLPPLPKNTPADAQGGGGGIPKPPPGVPGKKPPRDIPVSPADPSVPPPPTSMPTGLDTPVVGMAPFAPDPLPPRRPSQPTGTSPNAPALYRTVGILDGPNGPGTAFFISRDGLLATTRLVVGGLEQVTVELEAGRRFPAHVVRTFPEFDLAFVDTGVPVQQLLPPTPTPFLAENSALTAYAHNGRVMAGHRRAMQPMPPDSQQYWFPTTITEVADVGGSPVFDQRNFLVGMLTRNVSRLSAHVFGLHISTIHQLMEAYLQDISEVLRRVYCPSCGYLSRAGAIGGYYCETCGSVLPTFQTVPRFPINKPNVDVLYGENQQRPCAACSARVGYYHGNCLRCGAAMK